MQRGSGILLHITSLPGDFGIGDLGHGAYAFIDFLAGARQGYWQFLPTGPTSQAFDNSPYMSLSAFAGNPLLIDLHDLVGCGWLADHDLADKPAFSEYLVEFSRVIPYKQALLKKAFENFKGQLAGNKRAEEFRTFCDQESWLDDYALYMSIREEQDLKAWHEWPDPVARRDAASLAECRRRLADSVLYYMFEQFCFYSQWEKLHDYARRKRVSLIGDLPIYVGIDSADVWAHQDIFWLNRKTLAPSHVAGVPPDYFSETGQRWGNPLYQWLGTGKKPNSNLYSWWRQRFEQTFRYTDIVRIDHFRGFDSYWEIPAHHETAVNGRWRKGPGKAFFKYMKKEIKKMPIIAEDLGIITPSVEKLRDELGYPGMKILQFAFDSDETNAYLPHNFTTTNCVVYSGTHDNNTTLGWYLGEASGAARERIRKYAGTFDGGSIHREFIRLAFSSVADLAIIPLQDLLGFGEDCRMNLPSTSKGNWRWRCAPRFLSDAVCYNLRNETIFYNRACPETTNQGENQR